MARAQGARAPHCGHHFQRRADCARCGGAGGYGCAKPVPRGHLHHHARRNPIAQIRTPRARPRPAPCHHRGAGCGGRAGDGRPVIPALTDHELEYFLTAARVREMQGGRDYNPEFGRRMRGTGPWADLLAQRFAAARIRLSLAHRLPDFDRSRSQPPQGQMLLL